MFRQVSIHVIEQGNVDLQTPTTSPELMSKSIIPKAKTFRTENTQKIKDEELEPMEIADSNKLPTTYKEDVEIAHSKQLI